MSSRFALLCASVALLAMPLESLAAVKPLDPSSTIPLPFGGHRTTSSSSSSSASPIDQRSALRTLSRYEREATKTTISRSLRRVIALTNSERKKENLPSLQHEPLLSALAQAYAQDMAQRNYVGHVMPEGLTLTDRTENSLFYKHLTDCQDCTVSLDVGENVARGQKTARNVVSDWVASEAHRDNMVNPAFTSIGVGNVGTYWVQIFAAASTTSTGTQSPSPLSTALPPVIP